MAEYAKWVLAVFVAALLVVAGLNQLQKIYAPQQSGTGAPNGIFPQKNSPSAIEAGIRSVLPNLPVLAGGVEGYGDKRIISVSGQGALKSSPDQVKVRGRVETESQSAADAMAQNAEIFAKVRQSLAGVGIDSNKVSSTSYSIQPKYDYDESLRKSVKSGFTAVHSFEIDLGNRVDDAGKIVDAAGNAGALVDSIQFGLSDAKQAELSKQALSQAGKDAAQQAQVLAESLGVKVKQVLSASSSASYAPTPYYNYGAYARASVAEAAPTQVTPGELTVSSSASVVFEIE